MQSTISLFKCAKCGKINIVKNNCVCSPKPRIGEDIACISDYANKKEIVATNIIDFNTPNTIDYSYTPRHLLPALTDERLFSILSGAITMKRFVVEKEKIEYILRKYGTALHCNRFAIGNMNEFIILEMLQKCGLNVREMSNAKRIDIEIEGYGGLSIKYSSGGNIKLHNSNNCKNTDMDMADSLFLTDGKLFIITKNLLKKHNIPILTYGNLSHIKDEKERANQAELKNTTDGLELKRKFLNKLKKINYPYIIDFNIIHDKEKGENISTSRSCYSMVNKDFNRLAEAKKIYNSEDRCNPILNKIKNYEENRNKTILKLISLGDKMHDVLDRFEAAEKDILREIGI